ncbi:hypothetical protein [Lactiplantibacillus plantarum]|uniref:hypothetical protein n=1 Tax=Lactiplantibacillus plantarum TaxID=1590 RepID=UPI0016510939|nr:hypothetical protein [Lactiplantibacillus plantarum]
MSFFTDLHFLPGTHTSSYTSSVSNDIFGGFHSFILNLIPLQSRVCSANNHS